MAYKRRRVANSASSSSRSTSSARSWSISQRSSVPETRLPSTPALPTLPSRGRVSFRPSSSRGTIVSSCRDQDVIRADNIAENIETDADIQAREESDAMNETIMAVDMRDRSTVGCAYYVAREEKLYLTEDIKMAGLDIVDTLKVHAQPTVILISTRSDEKLEDHLSTDARRIDREGEANDIFGSYILDSRPSSEFKYEGAKDKLVSLEILTDGTPGLIFTTPGDSLIGEAGYGQGGNTGRHGRMMKLAGWIELESKLTIGCAGALLCYISKRRNAENLPNGNKSASAFRIKSIEMFTLSDLMFVNADTLASLQIIQSESHPNLHMQGPNKSTSGAKESLSVFGLFNGLARTPQGKQKLRQLFLRPSTDLSVIRERLYTISVLLRPDNSAALATIMESLKMIRDMRSVVVHLQKGINNSKGTSVQKGVWANLQSFTFYAVKVLESIRKLSNEKQTIVIANKLATKVDAFQLNEICQMISETVDFQRSAEQHRTTVLQGIDTELDKFKQTYDGMDSMLTQVATQLTGELPEWAAQYVENCVFFPQLGFLTAVPIDSETGQGKYEGEGMDNDVWNKTFTSNYMGYYKNNRMKEMDVYFGDIYSMICDREIEIIHGLAVKVLTHEKLLTTTSDLCGELDALVALAWGARKYNFNPPNMTTANCINIEGGRHLLQELTVSSYVPNDCFIAGGDGDENEETDFLPPQLSSSGSGASAERSMLLVTGPNYSGKSVYLKQNALIVYLAHIGSFVPARRATIGLTDKIMTRIATLESVSRNQSAFMIDLQQVALSIKVATRRSLIVIDEFGKGTNSLDGAGLAAGVFEYFLSLGTHSPKVIAATHFHEIFENGFLHDRPQLTFGHMEVRVDNHTAVLEDQITYLFNFMPGRSNSSFGTTCALLNGVGPAIVARAEELILFAAKGEDLVEACSKMDPGKTQDLEDAEQVGRQFLEVDFDKNATDIRSILQSIITIRSEE